MKETIDSKSYQKTLNSNQKKMFDSIKKVILQACPNVQETIFVKQPYFYLPEFESIKFHKRPSIMLSFFGNHVNIFAQANQKYEKKLQTYHFTEKHTLQIRLDQALEVKLLISLFEESLRFLPS
jgi:hypothetical protein